MLLPEVEAAAVAMLGAIVDASKWDRIMIAKFFYLSETKLNTRLMDKSRNNMVGCRKKMIDTIFAIHFLTQQAAIFCFYVHNTLSYRNQPQSQGHAH